MCGYSRGLSTSAKAKTTLVTNTEYRHHYKVARCARLFWLLYFIQSYAINAVQVVNAGS